MGHSGKKLDLTGQRFGKWTVLAPAGNVGYKMDCLCLCDGGSESVATALSLRDGRRFEDAAKARKRTEEELRDRSVREFEKATAG